MTLVAIHQPNYAPWLGYFHKLARADVFVVLDDVQFSKGSYINRVQIAGGEAPQWLTIPVRHDFGAAINGIKLARADWTRAHLDTLRTRYSATAYFRDVWRDVEALYAELPQQSLAQANTEVIMRLAKRLGITTPLRAASSLDIGSAGGDDRLIAICHKLGDNVTYLSGRGGAKYQDETKFADAAIRLQYTAFDHPSYSQGGTSFVAGLSVLDTVFHLGWKGAASLVVP